MTCDQGAWTVSDFCSIQSWGVLTQNDCLSVWQTVRKSRREAVCYQSSIGTQPLRVITQKTHSHQTSCLVPGLPLSPLLFSPHSFWNRKTVRKWQVWICWPLSLCWNEVGRNSSCGRERKVPSSGQIRFVGWRGIFCEWEHHNFFTINFLTYWVMEI